MSFTWPDVGRRALRRTRVTAARRISSSWAPTRFQKRLGHQGVETTAVYTRVEPQDLRKAVERAHPRERARGERR